MHRNKVFSIRAKSIDVFHLLRVFSLIKLLNVIKILICYQLSLLLKRSFISGLPVSASIEPSSLCNLKCPQCPVGVGSLTRKTGNMNFENFKIVLSSIEKKLVHLFLYFQGEPLLNKDFFNMVQYAVSKKIYTATSTNGHFLDKQNIEKIIHSGLNRLILSLDGTQSSTYEKYRHGGDFNKVFQGVQALTETKKILKAHHPYIVLQFIVLKSNEHEIKEAIEMAQKLGVDELQFKSAQVYDYENDHTYIPQNTSYSRYKKHSNGKYTIKKPLKNRCFRVWQGTVITWDGMVVPCCYDKDAVHSFGNLLYQKMPDIWKSKAYQDFRKSILIHRKKTSICCNCTE